MKKRRPKPHQKRQAKDKRTAAEQEARFEEARKIVAAGVCPICGTRLVRNNALPGWYQCGAFGEPYMREPEFHDLQKCSFQAFTE